jgi:hypothetical protein
MVTINEVKELLENNGFIKENITITWGHSEIKQFRRGGELINVQYYEDEVWSFIFHELHIMHDTTSINAKQSCNTYNGFETIEDIVDLCKFANNIKLTL